MERQGRLRRRWTFKPTGTGAGAQGVILFWDDTLQAYVPTETTEMFWDDTAKKFTVSAFESTGIATLADGSLMKTSAAPTTDAMIANKKYVDDNAGGVAGNDTEVQFNNSGVMGADAGLTYALATDILTTGTFNATDEENILQTDTTTIFKTGTLTDQNIFMGQNAGLAVPSGVRNVGIGFDSLRKLTTGFNNFGLGSEACREALDAHNNVAIGAFALRNNTTNNYNIAIGSQAVQKCTGSANVGIGYWALQSGTSIARNIGIGYESGALITTGDDNIFIGYQSGRNQTTNSDLLIIDNQDRGSAAAEITDCLLYGIFNATPASQSLRVNGVLQTSQGRIVNTTRITGNTTLDTSHHLVVCDTDGGAFTVTLPAGGQGTCYIVKNVGTSGIAVTLVPDGAETIEDNTVYDGASYQLVYETTEGWIIV